MRHTERVIGYIAISCDDVQDSEAVTSHVEEALLEAEKEGILHH